MTSHDLPPQVIITMALGTRSFLGGTARMEASNKHNGNHGPEWGTLPESKRHQQQIQGVTRKRGAPWRGLKLPWVSGGLGDFNPRGGARAVHSVPIGFGERIAFAPLALFGHLKTGGAASVVRRPLGAVPELGSCASSGHTWLLGVALQGGVRGTRGKEAWPLHSRPCPRVLRFLVAELATRLTIQTRQSC